MSMFEFLVICVILGIIGYPMIYVFPLILVFLVISVPLALAVYLAIMSLCRAVSCSRP